MNYEKKYEDALERASKLRVQNPFDTVSQMMEHVFPELKESEDERVRESLLEYLHTLPNHYSHSGVCAPEWIAWLERQGEQKPTQETESFEAEHGKYYYCIKDYFCGGRKQASKGDVIQALRGLPIMSLKDASEYFLPVNSIKCYSAWKPSDEQINAIRLARSLVKYDFSEYPTFSKILIELEEQLQKIKENKL